jgi:putative endonuclease
VVSVLRREKGQLAERQAARYLKRRGLKWVTSNYHSRFGEIDLVCKDGDQWVFVEVRSRSSSCFMQPVESINPAKQRRLRLTAEAYLQRLPGGSQASGRFDVVSVVAGRCQWIKNAF